jgi:hypothetical protein
MPHMAGRCTCGRRMHWPRRTRLGDTWECYRCGTLWTWSRDGTNPMHVTGSRPPATQTAPAPRLLAPPAYRRQPQGCAPALAMLCCLGGGVWWLVSQFV